MQFKHLWNRLYHFLGVLHLNTWRICTYHHKTVYRLANTRCQLYQDFFENKEINNMFFYNKLTTKLPQLISVSNYQIFQKLVVVILTSHISQQHKWYVAKNYCWPALKLNTYYQSQNDCATQLLVNFLLLKVICFWFNRLHSSNEEKRNKPMDCAPLHFFEIGGLSCGSAHSRFTTSTKMKRY